MSKRLDTCKDVAGKFSKRQAGAIRKEYTTVAHGFQGLAEVFAEAGDGDDVRQSAKIMVTADAMKSIGDLWKTQPGKDQMPWVDGLTEYHSMLTQYTEGLQSSKEAKSRVEEIEHKLEKAEKKFEAVDETPEGKEAVEDLKREADAINERANVIHMMTLSEIAHFHEQRRHDFNHYFHSYISEQIDFHQNIIGQLQKAKEQFTPPK
jgi:predicted ribosome quality control (RQC) complex YloA/Tae2 family protein